MRRATPKKGTHCPLGDTDIGVLRLFARIVRFRNSFSHISYNPVKSIVLIRIPPEIGPDHRARFVAPNANKTRNKARQISDLS